MLGAAGAGGLASLLSVTPAAASEGQHRGHRADRYSGQVVADWYRTVYQAIMDEGTTPPPAARIYACLAIAAYEAVVDGAPRLRSLAGQLNGLTATPRPDRSALHWPTVASAAIAACADGVLHAASASLRQQLVGHFATHLEQERRAGVAADVLRLSVAHGQRVGTHVAAWAAGDGADTTVGRVYAPPVGPDLWRSTPPNFGPAIDPHWGASVRPMALPSPDACAPPPPPAAFSTDANSAFRAQADAVLAAFDALTDEHRSIAMFWRDNPITSGLPSGHWMLLVGQLCTERGLTLDRTVEAHAMAGIALADAFTSCWYHKYVHNLLRPVSYIREHVPGREQWLSYVNTPQFPEYTSGHSVASRAVATVLTATMGTFPYTDRVHDLRNPHLGHRSFASFDAAADEAAHSRLLGGIHYPMGIDVGKTQGDRVGQTVLQRVTTRR
ncbi:hypothetical protein GCM10011354_17460 [Egicoccus halophilus]|uniref:PAP2 superfamily protein n=1 Tax=Egicoccus halophilus TaxID=1670830 RepID=A0A8J3A849_9ACTN|nr:hypothetical protein GCM10011354_17460 [Egicoccus halophilus]